MTMIDEGDFIVRLIDHKDTSIRGATFVDENGFASIYINARVSRVQQRKTQKHELNHIAKDDFYNQVPIDDAETQGG